MLATALCTGQIISLTPWRPTGVTKRDREDRDKSMLMAHNSSAQRAQFRPARLGEPPQGSHCSSFAAMSCRGSSNVLSGAA
jgi:hypothetical protein